MRIPRGRPLSAALREGVTVVKLHLSCKTASILKVWQCTVSLRTAQEQGPLRRKQRRPKICQKVPGRVQPGFHGCSWGTNYDKLGIWEPLTLPRRIAASSMSSLPLSASSCINVLSLSRADASYFGHQRFRWNEVSIFSPPCSASAQMIARSISATTFRERLGTLHTLKRKYWNLKWFPAVSSAAERFLVVFHHFIPVVSVENTTSVAIGCVLRFFKGRTCGIFALRGAVHRCMWMPIKIYNLWMPRSWRNLPISTLVSMSQD